MPTASPGMVTVLHPGEAGASIASALQAAGQRVGCVLAGRSQASRARASELGLIELETAARAAAESHAIVLACPPAAMPATVRSLGRFAGPLIATGAMAPASSRAVAAAAREVDGSYVGAAWDETTGGLMVSGPGSDTVAALWAGSEIATTVISTMDADAAPVLALLRRCWDRELAATAARFEQAAESAGLAGRLTDLQLPSALPACPHLASELAQMFDSAPPSVPSGPDKPAGGGGILRSLLTRSNDQLTLDEQLTEWGVVLAHGEAVVWFGMCTTDIGHCFVAVTQERLWRVDSDGTRTEPPRLLNEITELKQSGRRISVLASDWSIEIRPVAGQRRDIEGLRAALAREPQSQPNS